MKTKFLWLFVVLLSHLTTAFSQTCGGSVGNTLNIVNNFGAGAFNPTVGLPPGFTTYTFMPAGTPTQNVILDGDYSIINSVPPNPSWVNGAPDRTPNDNNGYMAFFNASIAIGEFYRETITGLCSGTSYNFSAWVANVVNDPTLFNFPNLTFNIIDPISNANLATTTTGNIPNSVGNQLTWNQWGINFTLPTGVNSVILSISNNNVGGQAVPGNDLAIDDIVFAPCGPQTTASFSNSGEIISLTTCVGTSVNVFGWVGGGLAQPAYQWQINQGGGWTNIAGATTLNAVIAGLQPGTYQIRLITADGPNISNLNCSFNSNILTLTVTQPCVPNLPNRTICLSETTILDATCTGATSYSWTSTPAGFTSNLPNPSVSPLVTTTYHVVITSGGGLCTQTHNVTVEVINCCVEQCDWSLTGNTSTNPGTAPGQNFLGTRDNQRLVIATNQDEKMTVLPNGNVGIGTNNPTARLHTTTSVRMENLLQDNLQTQLIVKDGSGNLSWRDVFSLPQNNNFWSLTGNSSTIPGTGPFQNFLGTRDNQRLVIATNQSERMTVLTNGNVGIGSTNPLVRLHTAFGTGAMGFPYEVSVFERAGDTKLGVYNSSAGGLGPAIGGSSLTFGYSNSRNINNLYPGYEIQYFATSNTENFLRFNEIFRNNAGTVVAPTAPNQMVINRGNVGIGLGATGTLPTAPTARLHTNGTVRFQNLPQGNFNTFLVADLGGNVFRRNFGGRQGISEDGEGNLVLGSECGSDEAKFTSSKEINLDNLNLYFNSSETGKLYVGRINSEARETECRELYTRLEISSAGLPAMNDYSSDPSTSGLRFTDLTAGSEPIENVKGGVLSLDDDGDVIWVKACCEMQKSPDLKDILDRLTKIEKALEATKEQASTLKNQLNQMDVVLSNSNIIVLNQNIPNPFAEKTLISYTIPARSQHAQIIFYNSMGETVKMAEIKKTGAGVITVYANDLSSGVYSYSLIIDGKKTKTRQMVKIN